MHIDPSQATPKPLGSLTRADVRNHSHLLTFADIPDLLRPMLVIRGRGAGHSVLTLGRCKGQEIKFVFEPARGAHVLRFASYADFRAREGELRKAMRGAYVVETEFELQAAPVKVARPAVEAEAEVIDTEADAQAAVDTAWEARWEARHGVLHRTGDAVLRDMIVKNGISGDRHAAHVDLVAMVLKWEKVEAIKALVFASERLPKLPEVGEIVREEKLVVSAGPLVGKTDAAGNLHNESGHEEGPAAGAGDGGPLPPLEMMAKMPIEELRALMGMPSADRRDILRAAKKKMQLQPAGA